MFDEQEEGRFGLAQWFDDLLFRIETWRPNVGATGLRIFGGFALVAVAVGWMVGRAVDRPPVEDRIPIAVSASSAGTEADKTVATGQQSGPGVAALQPDGSASTTESTAADGSERSATGEDDAVSAVVHVAGAVLRPGLVTVPVGSRIHDVVLAAGGPIAAADLHRLNLAAPVQDGMQVRVPTVDEVAAGPLLVMPSPSAGTGPGPELDGDGGPVDLNTASADLLDTLPGVGPATAAAILTWREENGGFHSIDDLLEVPGIGPAKLAAIEDLVAV